MKHIIMVLTSAKNDPSQADSSKYRWVYWGHIWEVGSWVYKGLFALYRKPYVCALCYHKSPSSLDSSGNGSMVANYVLTCGLWPQLSRSEILVWVRKYCRWAVVVTVSRRWADFGCGKVVICWAPPTVPKESSRGRSLCGMEQKVKILLHVFHNHGQSPLPTDPEEVVR